jgi:signal peptidase I
MREVPPHDHERTPDATSDGPPDVGPGDHEAPAWQGGLSGSDAPTFPNRPPEPPSQDAPPLLSTGLPHYPPHGFPPPAFESPAGEYTVAPPAERRSAIRGLGKGVREVAETIVLALLIFLLVRAVVQNFQVEGRSMEPTLQTEWYLLVNKALYWEINLKTVDKFLPFIDPGDDPTRYIFRGPQRGDVIVFEQPNTDPGAAERDFIKRVIALPGEVVEVHDGKVFIDGRPLDEPYIQEPPGYTCPAQRIPPGHYWVLGDNRNNSSDSHSWGPIPKENIIGQAFLSYWPFSEFGLVDNKHVKLQGDAPPTNKAEVPLASEATRCT